MSFMYRFDLKNIHLTVNAVYRMHAIAIQVVGVIEELHL